MLLISFLISHDVEEDNSSYVTETFTPILRALPGAEDVVVMNVLASTMDSPRISRQLQLRFADEDAMNAAFASAEGRALSRELMARQGKGVEMLTAEISA